MSELREIIREVIAQSDDLSVESLTIQTLSRITDSERARLFAESVPAVVASELHNTRFACRLPRPVEPVQTIRSAKVAAIRDDWRRKLDAVYATPTGNKRLGDFSSDDLRALADTCSRMAAMNRAKAAHFAGLAELVASQGVATLRDVSDAALSGFFEGAEA